MKLDARMRIELTEPLPAPPYFAAVILSFLEPLEPSFSLKLQTALLPEGLTRPIVEPIISNILKDKVFAVRYTWPRLPPVYTLSSSPCIGHPVWNHGYSVRTQPGV